MHNQIATLHETRPFGLRTILSVTTGRVLTEPKDQMDNGITDMYDLLTWMTMDGASTLTLGHFAREMKPHLFRLFPEFGVANSCLTSLDKWVACAPTCSEEGIKMWLTELKMTFPEIKDTYDVPQFPLNHEPKYPIVGCAD